MLTTSLPSSGSISLYLSNSKLYTASLIDSLMVMSQLFLKVGGDFYIHNKIFKEVTIHFFQITRRSISLYSMPSTSKHLNAHIPFTTSDRLIKPLSLCIHSVLQTCLFKNAAGLTFHQASSCVQAQFMIKTTLHMFKYAWTKWLIMHDCQACRYMFKNFTVAKDFLKSIIYIVTVWDHSNFVSSLISM